MSLPTIDGLPEESKIIVTSFSDDDPFAPGRSKRLLAQSKKNEPVTPSKALSCVSRDWRRRVKPSSFSRLQLRVQFPPEVTNGAIHSESFWRFEDWAERKRINPHPISFSPILTRWMSVVCVSLAQFSCFVVKQRLSGKLRSLIVSTEEDAGLESAMDRYSQEEQTEYPTQGSELFWQFIYKIVDPRQITVIGPPTALAFFFDVYINLEDAWVFPEMSLQAVTFTGLRPCNEISRRLGQFPTISESEGDLGFKELWRWNQIEVTDGSFLNAYASYEYFHKTPPSSFGPIFLLTSLRRSSVSYYTVFPFHAYIGTIRRELWEFTHDFNLSLAPDPSDRILDDPSRVGRADLVDCWREIEQIYLHSTHPDFGSFDWSVSNSRSFSSADVGIASIRDILEEAFARPEMVEWKKIKEGHWRLSDKARKELKEAKDMILQQQREDFKNVFQHMMARVQT